MSVRKKPANSGPARAPSANKKASSKKAASQGSRTAPPTAPGLKKKASAAQDAPAKKTKSAAKPLAAPAASAKEAADLQPIFGSQKAERSAASRTPAERRPRSASGARSVSSARGAQPRAEFPAEFLWGAATSATQIDGGDRASDWFAHCEKKGKILDGSSSVTACDHWNRYESDYSLMQELGLNAYRFGVDWSRFQPEADAPFDLAALEHVRGMLASLRRKQIAPLLTLFHFALPQWWAARGGFAKEENLPDFLRFCEFIVNGLGDLVSDYITINEPNVYALLSYVDGKWPPAKSGVTGYIQSMRVQRNLLIAHFKLYDLIRETHARRGYKSPRISIAKHLRVMDPQNPDSRLDQDRTLSAARRFNWLFCDCVQSGRLLGPLGRDEKLHDGPAWDFIGVNYYTRDLVGFSLKALGRLCIDVKTRPDSVKNDLGWEIYPEGLLRILTEVHERYHQPIRITENGLADAKDERRGAFIREHLHAVARALAAGVRVDGYYHWSLLDNFEWSEGYTAAFGLIAVDFATQARTVRPSAREYAAIIRRRSVD